MVHEGKRDGNFTKDMVRAICGVQLKDRKSAKSMLMVGLNETTDQLSIANSVRWWSCVEDRGWLCHAKDTNLRG